MFGSARMPSVRAPGCRPASGSNRARVRAGAVNTRQRPGTTSLRHQDHQTQHRPGQLANTQTHRSDWHTMLTGGSTIVCGLAYERASSIIAPDDHARQMIIPGRAWDRQSWSGRRSAVRTTPGRFCATLTASACARIVVYVLIVAQLLSNAAEPVPQHLPDVSGHVSRTASAPVSLDRDACRQQTTQTAERGNTPVSALK